MRYALCKPENTQHSKRYIAIHITETAQTFSIVVNKIQGALPTITCTKQSAMIFAPIIQDKYFEKWVVFVIVRNEIPLQKRYRNTRAQNSIALQHYLPKTDLLYKLFPTKKKWLLLLFFNGGKWNSRHVLNISRVLKNTYITKWGIDVVLMFLR